MTPLRRKCSPTVLNMLVKKVNNTDMNENNTECVRRSIYRGRSFIVSQVSRLCRRDILLSYFPVYVLQF